MGKKGSNTYQERPQSAQELRLLETQNQMLGKQIDIGQQQENRSQSAYDDWVQSYRGMETGEINAGANRANGYSNNPNIIQPDEYAQKKSEYESQLAKLTSELEGLRSPQPTQQTPTTSSVKGQ